MAQKPVELSNLSPQVGSRHRRKRLGIGEGSGSGKTSGRGTKGYGARSGWKQKPGFEGGQMPLHRRLPKFGFTSRKKVLGVNVFTPIKLTELVAEGLTGEITPQVLLESGFIRTLGERIKLLSPTQVSAKMTIHVHAASAAAKQAVEAAGGEVKFLAE